MAWWHRKSKPNDEPERVEVPSCPGQVIPCDDPQKVIILPKDPEPDLSTKPKDVVGYCFGFVCPKKHVFSTFETISIDGFKERRVCQECGGVGKPATVRRTAEARWGDTTYRGYLGTGHRPKWGWYNAYVAHLGKCLWAPLSGSLWTKYEFVHYLESPKRRKK